MNNNQHRGRFPPTPQQTGDNGQAPEDGLSPAEADLCPAPAPEMILLAAPIAASIPDGHHWKVLDTNESQLLIYRLDI